MEQSGGSIENVWAGERLVAVYSSRKGRLVLPAVIIAQLIYIVAARVEQHLETS